jgi:hypothetical protein
VTEAATSSETSVSIEEDRCLACRSAAAWNGHAARWPMTSSIWVASGAVVTACPGR